MKLKKILKNISYKNIKGSLDIDILQICTDSRLASYNNLFIAKKGLKNDASKFIYEAVQSGAIAIVTDIYDPFLKNVTQVICDDVNLVEADIAKNFYEKPSKDIKTIAITGTNGKTTSSYLIKYLLDRSNMSCGLIGTIENIFKDHIVSSRLTTPDNVTLQRYLKEMANSHLKAVCMEASSHGLEQNRLKNIDISIAIFTNLTIDHLDYHKTFENYKNSKKKLFDTLNRSSFAIVNIDDENYSHLIKDTKAKIFRYSINNKADLMATDIKFGFDGTYFKVEYKNKKFDFYTKLIGKYNVYNSLCAIFTALLLGIDIEKIQEIIKDFKIENGRVQKVENILDLNIYVDYAHTNDAMENVLKTFQDLKKRKIINVFGCGGDRDKSKRPLMAEASQKYSDISIVTSDNSRTEDPQDIINDIIKGFSSETKYLIEKDRKKAIEKAIQIANKDDIIVITGKGHETYQILKNTTINFDDNKIVQNICLEMKVDNA